MPCNGGLKPILLMYPFLCVGCIPAPRRRIVPANRAGRNVFPFSAAFGIGGRLKGYLKNKRRQGGGMHARPAPVAAYSDMAG